MQEVSYPLVCKKFVDLPTALAAKLYKRLFLGLVVEVVPAKTRREAIVMLSHTTNLARLLSLLSHLKI